MRIQKEIVVTDWFKDKPYNGLVLMLTLSSDQRKKLRGKRITDCNKELFFQLPREGKLNDGDILFTNHPEIYVKIIAKKENLIKVSSSSQLELIRAAYHLGNRHVEIEIQPDILLIKSDYVIEDMLKNFEVDILRIKKEFFPEVGAHKHA